jgi:hypothetical protein
LIGFLTLFLGVGFAFAGHGGTAAGGGPNTQTPGAHHGKKTGWTKHRGKHHGHKEGDEKGSGAVLSGTADTLGGSTGTKGKSADKAGTTGSNHGIEAGSATQLLKR